MNATLTEDDPLTAPAVQAELDLHTIDGALAHLRALLEREPWLAGAYRTDLAEIGSAFTELSRIH